MSAQPLEPDFVKLAKDAASDPNFQAAAKEVMGGNGSKLMEDVLKFLPLGVASMVARITLAQRKVSWGFVAGQCAAAGIGSVLVGLAITDFIHSENLRYACVGLAGYSSPELFNLAHRMIVAKAEQKLAQVEKKKPKTKKNK